MLLKAAQHCMSIGDYGEYLSISPAFEKMFNMNPSINQYLLPCLRTTKHKFFIWMPEWMTRLIGV